MPFCAFHAAIGAGGTGHVVCCVTNGHLRADRDRHSLYSREKVDGPTITHADYGMAPPLVRRIPRSFAGAKGVTKLLHIQHALETEAA